jgi:hypothetical protein
MCLGVAVIRVETRAESSGYLPCAHMVKGGHKERNLGFYCGAYLECIFLGYGFV